MTRRRIPDSSPAEPIAEAIGLPVSNVRAVLDHEDAPVVDIVKVGGFLRTPLKELFA